MKIYKQWCMYSRKISTHRWKKKRRSRKDRQTSMLGWSSRWALVCFGFSQAWFPVRNHEHLYIHQLHELRKTGKKKERKREERNKNEEAFTRLLIVAAVSRSRCTNHTLCSLAAVVRADYTDWFGKELNLKKALGYLVTYSRGHVCEQTG